MNFFEHQDVARKKTGRLIVMFAAAVVAIIAMVYLVFVLIFVGVQQQQATDELAAPAPTLWHPQVLVGVTVGVLAVVGIASLFKIAELSRGGRVIAESLGGRLISQNTTDLTERKVLNVVEEMAIASGTPVPPVYLLDHEQGINAFAAGYSPDDAVIGVTRGCAEKLTRDELQGVMAHEFSHILNGDMRLNIRLIGVVYGILAIGLIGGAILRSLSYGRVRVSSSRDKKGDPRAALMLFGLALVVIGYAGTFFGNLIKAAVSRQREFLADASAVQFTRYPDGIAGALRKIGGYAFGSKLVSPAAEQASHMYFSQGVSHFLGMMMATHPPLDERIRRIDPSWDGRYPAVPDEPAPAPAAAKTPRHRISRLSDQASGLVSPMAQVEQIGALTPEHIAVAHEMLESMPAPLVQAAHEPYSARAVLFALLLDSDHNVRQRQLERLSEAIDAPLLIQTRRLAASVEALAPDQRLPLAEIALGALRAMSPQQVKAFRSVIDALVRADNRVELFEWVMLRMIDRHLSQAPGRGSHRDLRAVVRQCELLLSTLARVGGRTQEKAQHAFTYGVAELRAGPMQLQPPQACTLDAVDRALVELDKLVPRYKEALLMACAAVIAADREVTVQESELLRGVAAALGCPMPPLSPALSRA